MGQPVPGRLGLFDGQHLHRYADAELYKLFKLAADDSGALADHRPGGGQVFSGHIIIAPGFELPEEGLALIRHRCGPDKRRVLHRGRLPIAFLVLKCLADRVKQRLATLVVDEQQRGSSAVVQLGQHPVDAPEIRDGDVRGVLGNHLEATLIAGGAQVDVLQEAVHIAVSQRGIFANLLPVRKLRPGAHLQARFMPALVLLPETEGHDLRTFPCFDAGQVFGKDLWRRSSGTTRAPLSGMGCR